MEDREKQMVKELCKVEEGLKDNEVNFIEDLSKRNAAYKLSEKQLSWLESIWRRITLGSIR